MFKIVMSSVAKWQDFKLSDLFNCTRGTRLTVENRELGNIPLVTAGEDNLGVKAFISNENQAIFSNSITIDMFCNSYTHIDKFCCDDNIIVLSAKTPLNKFIMLFINTLIKQDKYRYQYGRQYRLKHFNNHYIKLPATKEGSPDWQYMENYIKNIVNNLQLEQLVISHIKPVKLEPNTILWQNFKLSDLFNFTRGTRLTVENRELGNIPLVTAGEDNLGVKEFISNENQVIFSNSVTIDMFCNSYTHIDKFCCDDNIIVLSAKTPLNKFIMLFINTLIKQDKYRYQYGRQYRLKHFNNHYIKLPATEEGSPDWQYMENYIKQLSYSDKI